MKKFFQYWYLFLLTVPRFASAQVNPLESLKVVGEKVYGPNIQPDIKITIARIVQAVLGFVGILFIILIILGGFQWMTSGGNEQKIDEAKKRIANATIGLTVIVVAYSIAFSITRWLTQATTTGSGIPGASGPP